MSFSLMTMGSLAASSTYVNKLAGPTGLPNLRKMLLLHLGLKLLIIMFVPVLQEWVVNSRVQIF